MADKKEYAIFVTGEKKEILSKDGKYYHFTDGTQFRIKNPVISEIVFEKVEAEKPVKKASKKKKDGEE